MWDEGGFHGWLQGGEESLSIVEKGDQRVHGEEGADLWEAEVVETSDQDRDVHCPRDFCSAKARHCRCFHCVGSADEVGL